MNLAYERFRERMIEREVVRPDAMIGIVGCQHARSVAPDAKMLHVVAMTDRIALDRLVVVPRGCDTAYIDKNKRVFLDHDTDVWSCVGSIRDYKISDTDVRANVALATSHEDYADLVALASEVGIGTSIGFEVLEFTPPMKGDPPHYFESEGIARRWRWLELSLTMMPSDVYAQASTERAYTEAMTRSLAGLVAAGKVKARVARRLGYREVAPPAAKARRKIVFSAKRA